jgi:hypothetical protein
MNTLLRAALAVSMIAGGLAACSNSGDNAGTRPVSPYSQQAPADRATGSAMGSSTIGSGSNTNGIESPSNPPRSVPRY